MTQASLFKTMESIQAEKIAAAKIHAMNIWYSKAADYRALPEKYYKLLEEKKASGKKPLGKLRKEVLDEYPIIPFLSLETEDEALILLDSWEKQGCLFREIDLVEEILKTNNSINTIKAWCTDYLYNVSREKYAKEKKRKMKEMPPEVKKPDNLAEFMAGTMA